MSEGKGQINYKFLLGISEISSKSLQIYLFSLKGFIYFWNSSIKDYIKAFPTLIHNGPQNLSVGSPGGLQASREPPQWNK